MSKNSKSLIRRFFLGMDAKRHPNLIQAVQFRLCRNLDLSRGVLEKRLGKVRLIDEQMPRTPTGVGDALNEILDADGHLLTVGAGNGPSEWAVSDGTITGQTPATPGALSWSASAYHEEGNEIISTGPSGYAADPATAEIGATGPAGTGDTWQKKQGGLSFDVSAINKIVVAASLKLTLSDLGSSNWISGEDLFIDVGWNRQTLWANPITNTIWDLTKYNSSSAIHNGTEDRAVRIASTRFTRTQLVALGTGTDAVVIPLDVNKVNRLLTFNKGGLTDIWVRPGHYHSSSVAYYYDLDHSSVGGDKNAHVHFHWSGASAAVKPKLVLSTIS